MAQSFAYDAMGSHWRVTLHEPLDPTAFASLEKDVRDASDVFDQTYSRFKRDSLIWQLEGKTGTFTVPEDLVTMLAWYIKLYEPSGRKLNPLIGHVISDLGYDDEYTLVRKDEVRGTPDLIESVKILDATHLELTRPALIDLGALGKGFFVDRIASMVEERGITSYLVDGSGDIRYRGTKPLVIGMEDPHDATQAIGTLSITTGSVCASGTNRRRWSDDLHHVIDPHTSASTSGITATWVVAENATLADALASCLFFAEPKMLRTQYPFEYCVLRDDRSAVTSPGFPGTLF